MKISKTKALLVVAAASMSVTLLTGCKKKTVSGDTYTYNTYLSTNPKTWNVHDWETSDESYVPAFTEMGFYDLALNETKDGYVIVPEMAAEMPVDKTEDITDPEYERFGYKGNLDEGYVWEIALNQNACWEDGTPIKADDYVQSMERQLNPKMVNFRADSYYASSLVIAGAEKYFKQGRSTIEALFDYIKDDGTFTSADVCSNGKYYINIARWTPYVASVFSGTTGDESLYTVLNQRSSTSSDAVELAAERITMGCKYWSWAYGDHEGDFADDWKEVTGYSTLSKVDEDMMNYDIPLTDFRDKTVYTCKTRGDSTEANKVLYSMTDLQKDLKTVVSGLGRGGKTSKEFAWKLPLFGEIFNDYEASFDTVGIVKVDDYKIKLFLSQAVTALDLKFSLSGNWLVKVDLYDKLTMTTSTGLKATSYATPTAGVNGYMSYGPYKLESFESGKSFKMVKNDKWYGYTDGNHVGQYQMTGVYTRVISEHNVVRQEFEKGNLDDIELNRDDMKVYGQSSRKTSTYESYTQKISINSDRAKLKSRQETGKNKTVLSNYNFRKGLSLAMDRNSFAAQATSGSKAFTGLLNDLYLTNVETGEMYRNTPQGKSVYNQVYGELGGNPGDAEKTALSEKANGYNLNQATYYVAEGLKEELNSTVDGHISAGDEIDIEFRVYDPDSDTTKDMMAFLSSAFNKIIELAVAQLKADSVLAANDNITIKVTSLKDEDYYNTAKAGGYDMIFSTWGGAAINPVGLMQVYCDSTFESCCEYGFKGKQNSVTTWIDLDGDNEVDTGEEKSFNTWWSEISAITENDPYGSEEYNTKHNKILTVLAGLEAGILNRFEAIPLVARASTSLNSFKIENGTTQYVNLIGYGGIRHLWFNYTDAEWTEFINDPNYSADLYKA